MASPTEREIRRAVVAEMRSDPCALVIEELALTYYRARIDVSSVNGSLHGIEIKTDSDTLGRLPEQASAYSRVFDYVTIVIGTKHLHSIESSVPDWWGISVAQKEQDCVRIQTVRPPRCNPAPDPFAIASLLWKSELEGICKEHGVDVTARFSRKQLISALACSLELAELQTAVRDQVQRRINWRAAK